MIQFKEGDVFICRMQENNHFISGNKYRVVKFWYQEFKVCDLVTEYIGKKIKVSIKADVVFDYFYTVKETRKEKLKELNNVSN